ncbi:helix-turn-helix domain-containing protein [Chromobacterium vaccinii]|nr:helix-turn-helix domain-containing protein [Chromobacterium vaccinii]
MIGNRIREARKARNRTQKWLADEVGVKQSSACGWELGKTEPTSENMSRVAQALRVSFDWLATGRGGMELSFVPAELTVAEPAPVDLDQAEFLALFEQLPRAKRQILLQFMRDWVRK